MTNLGKNIQLGSIEIGSINSAGNSELNSENKKGIEMLNTEKQNWFSRNFSNTLPVKLLAGLALGAMLLTTIATSGTGLADEPSRPLSKSSIDNVGFGHYDDMVQAAKPNNSGGTEVYVPATNASVAQRGFGHYDDMVQPAKLNISGGTEVYVPFQETRIDFGALVQVDKFVDWP